MSNNKQKVVALLESIENGNTQPIKYINPTKYIQHNPMVKDGLAGFGEVMENKPPNGFKVSVKRVFEDGDYVFTHTEYDFFGPKVGFDIFRFENGLIVEHWDNLDEVKPANPSGRSQVDGHTEIKDLDKTEENRRTVTDFIQTVLVGGEFDHLSDFINGDNYIQHNAYMADGLSGLSKAVEEMGMAGITMEYLQCHKVLAEGNFVLAISEGRFGGTDVTYYDLFRLSTGKLVEHWDIIEKLLPESEWQNTNGKFGFV